MILHEAAQQLLHLCYVLPPIERYSPLIGGAISTFTMQQGRRLQARGHRISVVAPHEGEETYDIGEFFPLHGVTRDSLSPLQRAISTRVVRRLRGSGWLYQEHYFKALKTTFARLQPDAVLCFNDWQTPFVVRKMLPDARLFLRLSNECHAHASNIEQTIEHCETIWVVSSYIRDWTGERFPASTPKLKSLANGADLDSFFPTSDFITRVEKPNSPLKCLFLSRLHLNKGPDLATDAVLASREKGYDITLNVAGNIWFDKGSQPSPFALEIQEKAERAGGRWLGHVERADVPQLVREHDVLVLPIRWAEPMSQVILEAMASGLAIISCSLGGVPEECGEAALWATPNDAASVAEQLERLYNDRALLSEMKRKSVARAQEMTWDRNAHVFAQQLEGGNASAHFA